MRLFRKNLRQRRLEVRRSVTVRPRWYARWTSHRGVYGSLAIALMFFLLAAGMDVWPPDPLPYREGQYIPSDITVRVAFRVLSRRLFDEAKRTAGSSAPATFNLNTALLDEITRFLEKIPTRFQDAESLDKVEPGLRKELGLSPPAEDQKPTEASKQKSEQDQATFAAWIALNDPENRPVLDADLKRLRAELTRCYLVRPDRASEQIIKRSAEHVILMDGPVQDRLKTYDLIGQDETDKLKTRIHDATDMLDSKIRSSVEAYLFFKLSAQPIYLYDAAQSKRDKELAEQQVQDQPPKTCYKHYTEGQVLARNTQHPFSGQEADSEPLSHGLSKEELQLLVAEHEAYLAAEKQTDPWRAWLRLAGRLVVLLLLSLLLCVYIVQYQFHVVERNLRGFVLVMLLLVMLAIVKTTMFLPWMSPHVALLAVCMAGIILTIAYDQRFALAVGTILSAFMVFQIRGDFEMLVVLEAGLILCVFQLHQIRTRSRLVVISSISAGAVFVVVWAMSVQTGAPWQIVLLDSGLAAGSVLLAGLIVQALLPVIERIFSIATGSTLLEWCDASKPLLKRLAMESPGTYNHSLQLGTMCEAAAEAIGARGLLGRVGAYYHDIGKINKPEYFAENQAIGQNKHEKLSPAMSLLIIINHVKDGLEMARKYGLPNVLREFVGTHHGTMLVQYFYHTATKQSANGRATAPEESQYRYPGPKPHSKEAAILMLADGAESSVRAMSEPTPTSIKVQVNKIVTIRLEDGQLDECELTLREVHLIEKSIVKSLCGMYHARIAYPARNGGEKNNGNGKKRNRNAPTALREQTEKAPAEEDTTRTSDPKIDKTASDNA